MSRDVVWPLVCLALVCLAGTTDTTEISGDSSQAVCTIKGRVYTQRDWYGYLVHKVFHQGYAKIQYMITYPQSECCADLLIYYDDQVKDLRSSMTCQERVDTLPPDNNQVIPLRDSKDSTGCTLWNDTGTPFYVCLGERVFRSSVARTWFFAVSRCGQGGVMNLKYTFNITGYYGECEDDPLAPSSGWNSYVGFLDQSSEASGSEGVYKYLAIGLGILAGLALIAAAVFFGLWFIGVQNASKGKGSSVTSSQATMTQDDIFYVNPSLSDQGQQEYSQSGSENYYEVIPERRSYESINTGLANGTVHLRHMRAAHPATLAHHPHHAHHPHGPHLAQQPKDMGPLRSIHYPVFDNDYPPPPYQPPKLIGMGKHMGPGHAHTLSMPARHRPGIQGHPGHQGHQAYHSSIVPTPAALGHQHNGAPPEMRGPSEGQLSASLSQGHLMAGPSSSSGPLTHQGPTNGIFSFNNSGPNSSNSSSMINNPSSIMSYDNNGDGHPPGSHSLLLANPSSGAGLPHSSPNSLASFSGGPGISLTPMHQRIGSAPAHSMSNMPSSIIGGGPPSSHSGPPLSLAQVMSSAQSHVAASSAGQMSETSA